MIAATTHPELLEAILAVRNGGVSIIPVQHWDKRPYNDLLPRSSEGKPTWAPFQRGIASEEAVREWAASGLRSFAAVCGKVSRGLVIIDFDEPRLFDPWLEAIGHLATDLVIQKTGGGGYQAAFRCDNPGSNEKLAWVPDEDEETGRRIGIETRGEGGYAVVAPSLHPTGNRYQLSSGSFADIQHVPQAVADALLNAARKLDEAPKTRQQQEAEALETHAKEQKKQRASLNGEANVIDEFNKRHSIEAILESKGYTKLGGGRYSRPGGTNPSVSIKDGRACFWNTNDALCDGKGKGGCGVHDAFDVVRLLDHGGDFRKAVREAAKLLGMEYKNGNKQTYQAKSEPDQTDATAELRTTELRNAELVCEQNRDDIRFHVARGDWLIWAGSYWKRDEAGYVQNRIKDVARGTSERLAGEGADRRTIDRTVNRMESAAGVSGVEKLLRYEPPLPVSADALDRDNFALNVLNGTIDLRTGKLNPHNRDAMHTRVLPFEFDPAAQSQRWNTFIDEITDGNKALAKYLQFKAGLYASGDTSVQEFDVYWGAGANGKSVFIDTLLYTLGEYAGVAPDSLLMARRNPEHPCELATLLGKRLVVASETEEGGTLRLQQIKRLTGDEWITARFMHKDFFTFRRTHKLLMVTNNRPRVPENTEAAWRRIRLVPFTVTIPEEKRDKELLAKLKREVPGILAWIVRGSVERLAEGICTPSIVTAATTAYRGDSDPLADYVTDRLILGETFRAVRGELWTDYEIWASKAGEKGNLTREGFYGRIRQLHGVQDGEWKAAGRKVRGFLGVGLCPSSTETP